VPITFGVLPSLVSGGTVQTPVMTYSGGLNTIQWSIDGLLPGDLSLVTNSINSSMVISQGSLTFLGAGFSWQGGSGVSSPVLSTSLANLASGSLFFIKAVASGNFSLGISGVMA
jgi:hypothetical protein